MHGKLYQLKVFSRKSTQNAPEYNCRKASANALSNGRMIFKVL